MSVQLDQLRRRLEGVVAEVKRTVQPALQKSGNEIAGAMRTLAESSRDTGALIESITVTPGGQTTPAYSQPGGSKAVPENAIAITVGNSEVRYPHLVEYGTTTTPAQPFFWISFRLMRKRAENRIKRSIGKAVLVGWAR